MKKLYSTIFVTCALLASCSDNSGEAGGNDASLLRTKLTPRPDTGVLIGHYDDLAYGSMWYGETNRSDMYGVCNDYPAVFGWDISGIGQNVNRDSVAFSSIASYIALADRQGGVSTIRWEIRPEEARKPESAIAAVSAFLKSLTNEDGENIPIIFQPVLYETGLSDNDKQMLYRQIHETLDRDCGQNILFAYADKDIDNLEAAYPGDDLTDIIGVEFFPSQEMNEKEISDQFADATRKVCKIANNHKKLAAVTATGLQGIKIHNYFTSCLLPSIQKKGLSYIMFWKNSWRNENDYYIPVKGHPAADDFRKFIKSEQVTSCSELKK